MLNLKTMMLQYMNESPAITETLLSNPPEQGAAALVEELSNGKRFVITGCGTSYHTALLAARFFEAYAGVQAEAVPSFDLAWYRPAIAKDAIVLAISHSGASKATRDAVAQTKGLAARQFGMSAAETTFLAKETDVHIPIPGSWETALPKTRVFTAGSFWFLHLAYLAGQARGLQQTAPLPAPAQLREAMVRALEANHDVVNRAAAAWKDYGTYSFFGGGPAWVTAVEAALKMRENNYTQSDGHEAEELSHGRTASFEPDRPIVGILLRGPSVNRVNDMLETARFLNTPTMAVVEEGVTDVPEVDFRLNIPAMPSESAAAVLATIPLQLLSHQLSLHRGVNPDTIRLHQPARKYVEDKWIFPPGTH